MYKRIVKRFLNNTTEIKIIYTNINNLITKDRIDAYKKNQNVQD